MNHEVVSRKSAKAIAGARQHAVGPVIPVQVHTEKQSGTSGSFHLDLAQFDSLPDSAYVRQPVVLGLFAFSQATLWRSVKASLVPSPRKIGGRISAWNVGELREVLRTIEASGNTASACSKEDDHATR